MQEVCCAFGWLGCPFQCIDIVDPEYAKEVISKLLGEMNKWRAYWMQEMQLRHCCQNEVFEYKHMVRCVLLGNCVFTHHLGSRYRCIVAQDV